MELSGIVLGGLSGVSVRVFVVILFPPYLWSSYGPFPFSLIYLYVDEPVGLVVLATPVTFRPLPPRVTSSPRPRLLLSSFDLSRHTRLVPQGLTGDRDRVLRLCQPRLFFLKSYSKRESIYYVERATALLSYRL
jgi:hypothetical protein